MIAVVDYQTVDPFSFVAPPWFDRYERFQIVALEDRAKRRYLVGRWEFRVARRPWTVIDSQHTRVTSRLRREGLAVKLWQLGIDVWAPAEIKSTIVSYAGCALLAKMRARLAGTGVHLNVSFDGDDGSGWRESFERMSAEAAEREIARLRNPPATRKLEVVK